MKKTENFEAFYKSIAQFDDFLGMQLQVRAPGDITYRLEVMKHHMGAPDACHGGVISALVDSTLGVTALTWAASKGNLCSTVEFKVNYLSPARLGETIEGKAEIDFAGSKLIIVSGKLYEAQSGRMIAKGMGTFSQYPISKKADQINSALVEKPR